MGINVEDSVHQGELLAGRYRVLRRLGIGGMGTVYLAEHVHLGRLTAVKVLCPPLCDDDPRAERSEEHTSELQSPCNIVCRLLLEKKKTQQTEYDDTRMTRAPLT